MKNEVISHITQEGISEELQIGGRNDKRVANIYGHGLPSRAAIRSAELTLIAWPVPQRALFRTPPSSRFESRLYSDS